MFEFGIDTCHKVVSHLSIYSVREGNGSLPCRVLKGRDLPLHSYPFMILSVCLEKSVG